MTKGMELNIMKGRKIKMKKMITIIMIISLSPFLGASESPRTQLIKVKAIQVEGRETNKKIKELKASIEKKKRIIEDSQEDYDNAVNKIIEYKRSESPGMERKIESESDKKSRALSNRSKYRSEKYKEEDALSKLEQQKEELLLKYKEEAALLKKLLGK